MRALIFNPSFIGDSILTTPLVNAVANLDGVSDVYFCVRPESGPIFIDLPFNVIVFDKRGKDRGIIGLIRFIYRLKKMRLDIVYSPHRSFRTALLLFLTGIPIRIGFRQSVGSFLYTRLIERDMNADETKRCLNLLSPDAAGKLTTCDNSKYKEILEAFLATACEGKSLIGISAGSVWHTKRYPPQMFAELARMFYDRGYCIAILGGIADEPVNNDLRSRLDFEFLDFGGNLDFSLVPALVSCLAALISNDSAPVHIARSKGIPVVAIFGPTSPKFGFAPIAPLGAVCEVKELYCRPCSIHGGKYCPEKHFRCMREISPQYIFDKTMELLNEISVHPV
jgi:heptosyltransferase-2